MIVNHLYVIVILDNTYIVSYIYRERLDIREGR